MSDRNSNRHFNTAFQVVVALVLLSSIARAETIAITHVSIIDVEHGGMLLNKTVTIRQDHIASVGRSDKPPPTTSRVVDGTGKFLIPGLWDMHVHGNNNPWYADWFPLYIVNGVTGVREMFGPADANKFHAEVLAKHIDAPHIYMASPIVDGDPPDWPNSVVVRNSGEARSFVDEQKARGADFIKVYNHLGRAEYFAILDEARKQHIPVSGHVPYAISAEEASAAGQVTTEHLYGIPTACSSHEHALQARLATATTRAERREIELEASQSYDPDRCDRLFSLFRRKGTWPVPTLAVFNADFVSAADTLHADPRLRYFFGEGRKWLRGDDYTYLDSTNPDELANARTTFAFRMKLTGALFRAGVPMLAGTDTGNAYTFPGFSLHEELALMVRAGATPLQALQSATCNPAIFMRMTHRYGSIESGKVADLLLLDANPLVDIQNTTRIAGVFLGGKYFDRTALDVMLSEAAGRAAAAK